VGFVFQSFHLFPTLSATDNVRVALDVRGVPARSARARSREALARVGLLHKTKAFPRELSGGEQQRVAIARAIVGNPSIILADEPTAALDGENGQVIVKILAEIAKEQGHAVLIVTHDPRLLPFADRVVHIEDGRIVREELGAAKLQ
jgi:putative ABC transport system ATP-binding protein